MSTKLNRRIASWFSGHHHRGASRWEQANRMRGAIAATVVAGLATSGLVYGSTQVSASESTELKASWRETPPPHSVPNGRLVEWSVWTNVNDASGPTTGRQGVKKNDTVTVTFAHGAVSSMPSACRSAEVTPASSISGDGRTLTCNLGDIAYGTAIRIDGGVNASGDDGDALTGTVSTPGATDVQLVPIRISAAPGIDVVMDGGGYNQPAIGANNRNFVMNLPVGVALPVGAATLAGPIDLDVTITNNTTTNADSVVVLAGQTCASGGPAASDIPSASGESPTPTTCSMTQAGHVIHVHLDGYKAPQVGGPTASSNGTSMRSDESMFASFAIPLTSTSPTEPNPGTFYATVSHVVATTVSGTSAPESDRTNNQSTITVTPPGTYASAWSRDATRLPALPNGISDQGGAWTAKDFAVAGDLVDTSSETRVWGTQAPSTIPAAARITDCVFLDGAVHFTGAVANNLARLTTTPSPTGGSYTDSYYLPSATTWEYTTDALPPTGQRGGVTCDDVHWSTASTTVLDTYTASTNRSGLPDWSAVQITGVAPSAITGIRRVIDPHKVRPGVTLTPVASDWNAGARIEATATAADTAWELGDFQRYDGTWGATSTQVVTKTPVANDGTTPTAYAGTTGMRDIVYVQATRPAITKAVSHTTGEKGDTVTFTITSGESTSHVDTVGSWRVVDHLPAGYAYAPGSASLVPTTVTNKTDGSTTIEWSYADVPMNTVKTLTYRATVNYASGTQVNQAQIETTDVPNYVPTSANHGVASAGVTVPVHGRTYLTKTTLSKTFAAGATNTWRLGLENLDTADQAQTDIIDVLPWNGDARGTRYHGAQKVLSVSANPGETVYYSTAPPASIDTDPAAPANGGFANPAAAPLLWSTTFPANGAAVTAIRIVGGVLPVGAAKSNDIRWEAVNARSGDAYENVAWAKATHTLLQMIKADATTTTADGSKLQIAKLFESSDGWAAGQHVSYHVTVHNPAAATALAVTVDDVAGNGLDPATIVFSELSQGDASPGTHSWSLGDLPAGGTATATVTATIAPDADRSRPFENRVTVKNPSNPYDVRADGPCQQNNQDVHGDTDQCDLSSIEPPKLHIDKRVDGVSQDGTITWTLRVRLDGSTDTKDVSVADTYPVGTVVGSVRVLRTPTQGAFDSVTGRWQIGTMHPGQVASMTFRAHVRAPAGSTARNVAEVTSPDVPRPGNPASCQANDGPTVAAALDADTDQCDETETVLAGPPQHVVPSPQPPLPVHLPDTGGPEEWVGVLGAVSALAATGMCLFGRRRGTNRAAHRA